jgi:anaerobic selenocysteine-containing dehydrogenase
MHNHQRLVKGKPRYHLLMHPDDVAEEGWETGMQITISSRVGQLSTTLMVSDEVMPGVVSLPHGYGHGLKGTRSAIANANAGVSCNDITDEHFLDQLSGNAAINGVPVELSGA